MLKAKYINRAFTFTLQLQCSRSAQPVLGVNRAAFSVGDRPVSGAPTIVSTVHCPRGPVQAPAVRKQCRAFQSAVAFSSGCPAAGPNMAANISPSPLAPAGRASPDTTAPVYTARPHFLPIGLTVSQKCGVSLPAASSCRKVLRRSHAETFWLIDGGGVLNPGTCFFHDLTGFLSTVKRAAVRTSSQYIKLHHCKNI